MSSMPKAYLDTTILTDALLKPGAAGQAARAAIKRFAITELPVYAIKEFKAGPLQNFAWIHNKLVGTRSFAAALDLLHGMSRTPRRYTTSTAIEALREAASSIGRKTNAELAQRYGQTATLDRMLYDEFRLAIRMLIERAWRKRRKVSTHVVQPLSCYPEATPHDERGLVVLDPCKCRIDGECCMAAALKAKPELLRKLRDATLAGGEGQETKRRAKALRNLYRSPKQGLTEDACRALGDAIIVFFAPNDATILTRTSVTTKGWPGLFPKSPRSHNRRTRG